MLPRNLRIDIKTREITGESTIIGKKTSWAKIDFSTIDFSKLIFDQNQFLKIEKNLPP